MNAGNTAYYEILGKLDALQRKMVYDNAWDDNFWTNNRLFFTNFNEYVQKYNQMTSIIMEAFEILIRENFADDDTYYLTDYYGELRKRHKGFIEYQHTLVEWINEGVRAKRLAEWEASREAEAEADRQTALARKQEREYWRRIEAERSAKARNIGRYGGRWD